MNGQAGGSTLGNTFGQGTSWVPLGLAALGGGLAGAGRAGSPASNMGSGLMSSMLGYYANQAATADERARRMKIEDESLQRQKDIDAQNRQVQFGNLAIQSGHGVSMQPVPGAIESTIGGQKVWFTPKQDFPIEAFAQMAETAFPGSGESYRKSMGLVPAPQRAALAEPMFKASQAGYDRTQTQNLFNTIGALGRPTPNVTPEMELGMGTPPPMSPPSFTPAQVAMYQQAAQFPESRQQAFKTMQEHLAELTPGAGPPVSTTPVSGTSQTRTETFEPGHRRPKVSITTSPENPQRALDTKETAVTIAEAERLEKSPGYKALYQAADASGKEALTTFLNLAKQGIPSGLQSLVSAMSNTGTSPDSLDKAKLDYYKKTGQLNTVLQNSVVASAPDRVQKEHLVQNIASNIKNLEADLALLPSKHPDYPNKAKRLAAEYRALADASPEIWGKRAFQKMAELLGWSETQYRAEASQFAAQHGIPLKGGQ
jgi:hypothetical protein